MAKPNMKLLGGVVEGFYGKPWTMEQRKELFRREQKWGLNAYLYAPKDDYKHRMYWRDLYTPQEAGELQNLIASAKEHHVEFIYAISPGLDVTFSNPKEVATLKRKIDQVWGFGCRSFAVLFDDIEAEMCPADKDAFSSLASAQVHMTNEVYQHIAKPETFLFCPTDYCAAFCTPSVAQSPYLHTVGEELHPDIDVLWTGPKVVSKEISVESIDEVTGVLKRAPVIWDNIHANDYDPQRMMLGPFKDRPVELIPKIRGILTNPNCEFELNFVAIHTLATWCKSYCNGETVKGGKKDYIPQEALVLALSEWLVEFSVSEPPGGGGLSEKNYSEEVPMRRDAGYVPGPREKPLFTAEPLILNDLVLLSDLFYLPYEHGPTSLQMLQELHWLKSNSNPVGTMGKDTEWGGRAEQFDKMCESVVQMFNRLSNVSNRRILYDLYNYICDIKSGVSMARDFVKTMGGQTTLSARQVNDPEPWGFRGAQSGEFQRMLPNHGYKDVFYQSPRPTAYVIRPYTPSDQSAVQKIFKEVMCEATHGFPATKGPMVLGHRLACGQLVPSPNCAFLMEDEGGVCGYALGLTDAKSAASKDQYPESLLGDNPSVITMQILPKVSDPRIAKRLVDCLISALRTTGCKAIFCELREREKRMLDILHRMGSFRAMTMEGHPNDPVIMRTTA
ncbi:protein O-GlcNAcase isoform X2 [Clupea harengus]|uniref:protein O-GlcNAcase n=1 Tax=Clupea harengus TaxID=7950 RepID=A0A6P8FRU9_CLUHA|nr:protein O-GlcNAcase isoform X2 [Clupea harengus]